MVFNTGRWVLGQIGHFGVYRCQNVMQSTEGYNQRTDRMLLEVLEDRPRAREQQMLYGV